MLFFIVISILIGLSATENNYCISGLCSKGTTHIACGNTGEFSQSCPADRKLINLSANEIGVMLRTHNMYRSRIASGAEAGFLPAARMATMTWSSELADLAALNVKQCQMKHDSCRNTAEFKWVGQNLAYLGNGGVFEATDTTIEKAVKSWYDEVSKATKADIDNCCNSASLRGVRIMLFPWVLPKYPRGFGASRQSMLPQKARTIGHFTQLVQDRAIKIGCAIAQYTEGRFKTSLVACNYAFTNFSGSKVYVSGKAASNCITGTNPDFPALCSVNEPIEPSA